MSPLEQIAGALAGPLQLGHNMIEQPPKPDVPHPPDVIRQPQPVNKPIPPGEPDPDDRPDVHPVPPPTDPGPAAI